MDITTPQAPVQEIPQKKSVKIPLILFFTAGIILLIVLLTFQKSPFTKTILKNSPLKTAPLVTPQKNYTQWINCDDVRNVIEENNSLYVACLGGVLIIDTSGSVIDQISMTDGLGNATTTSLEKSGSTLYIGTQDGFTIFDLKTRKAKKISVGEGLISGSNIKLALDGDTLWVGSFEGLSTYHTKTGKVTNFTTELVDKSTKYNASRILVTPKAIYAVIIANAYTPGGVARFDKQEKTWERFGPSAFLDEVNEYSRVDFFHLTYNQSKIYVAQSGPKPIWEQEDTKGARWKKIELPLNEKNSSLQALTAYKNGIAFVSEGKLYTYDSTTQKLTNPYPSDNTQKSLLSNSGLQLGVFAKGSKIWGTSTGTSSQDLPWLAWLNLQNLETGIITIKNRPISFEKIAAIIDNTVLVYGSGSIYSYNSSSETFKKLFEQAISVDLDSGGQLHFEPIPQTQFISLFNQSCGQGCSKPEFALYDYIKQQNKIYKLPENLQKQIENEVSVGPNATFTNYSDMQYGGYNEKTKELIFTFSTAEKSVSAYYNLSNNSWRSEEKDIPKDAAIPIDVLPRPFCNPVYTFVPSGNKFSKKECWETLENPVFKWTIDGNKVLQENKNTGEKTQLVYPVSPPEYSPFPDWDTSPAISYETIINDRLWLATNRGLSIYDPKTKKWKLISTKEGLVSNEIDSFVVGRSDIWIISGGGLSRIPID